MRLLVTGARGALGSATCDAARAVGLEVIATARGELPDGWTSLDLASDASVEAAIGCERPDAVIHTAAVTSPVWAEKHPDTTMQVNRDGSASLARACRRYGARLVALSTDLVFPGRDGGRYREDDATDPLSLYGVSKLASEVAIQREHAGALVVRTSLILAPGRGHVAGLTSALESDGATLYDDEWRSPILATDLARALILLATDDVAGILHVAGPDRMSRLEMGQRLARALDLDATRITPSSRRNSPPPPRPSDISLDSERALARLPAGTIRSIDAIATVIQNGEPR